MKHSRFYLMEENGDKFTTWLTTLDGEEVLGFLTYSEAVYHVNNELASRRKGKSITIMERRETFQSPPSDIVTDGYNAPDQSVDPIGSLTATYRNIKYQAKEPTK